MENEGTAVVPVDKSSEGIMGWIESVIITVSQTSLGQALLKLVDRFLWVVEKSAEWSLPAPEVTAEENGKTFGKMELVRPLPWILFLPGLVILRAIRGVLNVGACILGYPQIQPSGMVKFVQKSRRRLRAMNLKAVKSIRRKTCSAKDKRLSVMEAKKALIRSIKLTLSTLSCLDTSKSSPSPPPTKIRISGIDLETAPTPDEKSTTESAGSPMHTEVKRKFSEVSSDEASTEESENETLKARLERLAMDDSTDDPDFNPAECSTESSSPSSGSEANLHVSLDELDDIKKDALKPDAEVYKKLELIGIPKEHSSQQKTSIEERNDNVSHVTGLQSIEKPELLSPNKFGQEVETAFYSPISSKSGSPERSISPYAEKEPTPHTNSHSSNDFINGEMNYITEVAHGAARTEEVTNGVVAEKRNANAGKLHHKGKRGGHGNRKKK